MTELEFNGKETLRDQSDFSFQLGIRPDETKRMVRRRWTHKSALANEQVVIKSEMNTFDYVR